MEGVQMELLTSKLMGVGTSELMIFFVVVIAAVFAFVSGEIASRKGYSFAGYAVLGFFLPIIGLIVAAVLPDKKAQQAMVDMAKQNNTASNADELIKYKMLLDQGAITQDEYDKMKQTIMDGNRTSGVIDENNPVTIEVIHLKNGNVSVILDDNGDRSQYYKSWNNPNNRNKEELTIEIATEIQNEIRRKVFYKTIIK